MNNKRIAEIFYEIADMLEIEGERTIFEIRAYRKAALTIETLQEDLEDIYKKRGLDGLMELPGIGKGIAGSIEEYIKTGRIKKYEKYKKKYPIDFTNLTQIQGLGPKKAYRLYKVLGVKDIATLKQAVDKHKIRELEGFGERSESEIGKGMGMLDSGGRQLLGRVLPEAEAITRKLLASQLADRVEIAGSIRRMKETVGDIDILVISSKAEKTMDFISKMDEVENVLQRGPTKITLRLKIGLNCDIRVIERRSFGAGMQYFIGGKAHNVKMRQIAIKQGYKLNEYGLLDKKGKNVGGEEEKSIYEKLGLQYMEPEMREDRGEIELAQEHKIPRLVQLEDMRGDLHMHTKYTDGANTIEEMVKYAIKIGREYVGFTDHSVHEYVTGGMDEKKYERYSNEIDAVRKKYEGKINILKSAETDILKDGSLDFGKKSLDKMDYVLGAIHTNLNMPKDEMTKRLIRCIEANVVDIIAHPTSRLINKRQPINLDLDKVFEAAKDHNVIMEIDSFPDRLDLNDENIFRARQYKLKFSIDTDAHRTDHMEVMRYGVGTAKRGWLKKEDVINTMPFNEMTRLFKRSN